ncbi:BgTH12-00388 [Blumeria graminis f. sp. triticale]|uniref:Bgt-1084 n=3 Tax=Blumeria graminis TaxID=34373 RepID=A0A061HK62_BLUGR|nr:Phosphatase subunit of the trehalose-6-phosphate synthase-phosphatase complex [Blumeria graminis f. sp. tritici 96224]CAD6504887.1 BgTH12-00388 [Blumeria graminis f. sp. triticale]VDB92908.1 Bgt-1084 [Blumeria graminis f. sp. tritici]
MEPSTQLPHNTTINNDSSSATNPGPQKKYLDPRTAYPHLGLSGNVISANICIPYSLQYRKESEWELEPRRGTSALFDSFAHLSSSQTPWNHTLVGWTGEVTTADITPPLTPPSTTSVCRYPPLNKSSAPIPIDGSTHQLDTSHSEGLWISKEDQEHLEWQLNYKNKSQILPVWLDDETESTSERICLKDQARWRRYAEQSLYTLFHYKQNEPTDARTECQSWTDYKCLNEKFAYRILEKYKPGDIVVIHNYHLLLLPKILRNSIPHMYIVFFLHIPFPSSEFLRCLPRRKEVLEGVLGANLVGFQNLSYSRHFVSCCTRILGFPSDGMGVEVSGRKVTVGVFPIGIDAGAIEKSAFNDPIVDKKVEALRGLYEGKKIIVGRDRLDTVRGVAQKLMAFERFLSDYPQWQGNVVLIQVTNPVITEKGPESADNKVANQVSELVANINGVYGSLSFSPVQYYPQYLSQPDYLALLRAADIGLITSVRDGINTTSLEYIVCQRDKHNPLILSEFSGTAGSLKEAIHINPWDVSGVGKQINSALTMSAQEKATMHKSLYSNVTSRNIQAWTDGYLSSLLSVLNGSNSSTTTPLLDKTVLVRQYHSASKRLFMFDYDGTLTPIVRDPAAALPSKRLICILKTLAADSDNSVWIISGRDQDFLQKHLGDIEELGFSAEHGSFIRHPRRKEWENLAEVFDLGWQKVVLQVLQRYTERTPGSFIERKRCALTWHYRPSDPVLGAYNADECRKELEKTVSCEWDIEVMMGKANLEVRPTFINKGEIAKRLISESVPKPEFVFCLGDDSTDEDMFRALDCAGLTDSHYFTVKVGESNKVTRAHWNLPEPADVVASIALLCGKDNKPCSSETS